MYTNVLACAYDSMLMSMRMFKHIMLHMSYRTSDDDGLTVNHYGVTAWTAREA